MSLPEPRADLGLREGYHSPQVDVAVRLNTNESPFPPPAAWVEQMAAEVGRTDWHRYPDRAATGLRVALAALHSVRPDQVFAANGSNEVLQCLCLAYGGPGRSVATFEPTYALHAHIAHVTGTSVVTGHRRPDFTVDVAEAMELVGRERPALTFLCSPNNPTGTPEIPSTVESLTAAGDTLIVVDEAYGQFADWSAIGLVEDDRPLAVVRTFSKTWAMAGVRLGYLVAPAAVVAACERVALPYHLDVLKQAAGRLALDHVDEMTARVAVLVDERERLVTALGRLPVTVWPSQANFILWRPEGRPAADVWRGLVDRSVLVRSTATWPGLEGCLRVTVGTPAENDLFLAALADVLTGAGVAGRR